MLGEFSFGRGFGLCLAILLAPWGCRRAYCGPHCGRESARVLPSLLGPSPSGVRHLSRVCSSVGGRRSRSLIPSLAPSWWCPCPLMRWALLMLSGYVLSVPSAFSLRRSRWSIPSHCRPSRAVSADGFRLWWALALAEGRLPISWVPSEPLGICGGSTYIALHRIWLVSAILTYAVGAQVGVSYFSCATFRKYSWRSFYQFH